MNEEEEQSAKQLKNSRPWLFKKGQSGNPSGRPAGSISLKTWAKAYLASMDEEERLAYLDGMPKEVIWKMAEGNAANNTDITSAGERIVFMPPAIAEKNGVNLESDTNTSAGKDSAGHN